MLQSDTLREGKKKLETKFIFPIDRDRDNVGMYLVPQDDVHPRNF